MLVSGRVVSQQIETDTVLANGKIINGVPSLKLTFSQLKMDGWNTIVSFWDGLFLGANC